LRIVLTIQNAESEIQSFRILSKERELSHEYAAAHFILDVLFTIRYSTIQS